MSGRWWVFGIVLFIVGCGGMNAEDFKGQEPRLVIEDYFAGKTEAWGIFEDRFGKLRRQFKVDIDGTWDGEELTLVEDFVYADGELQQRVWRIRKIDEHRYEGRADDVIGVAEGTAYGNALNWRYVLALPIGDNVWNVTFDDWMFLQEGDVLINRATVSKFGFTLGEVTLFFRKPSAAEQALRSQPAIAAE